MQGVSHPHFRNVFLGHVTSVIYIPNYFFYFHMSTVNHVRNKILSAQRNIHNTNFMQGTTKKMAFWRGFLFARRKRHARVRSIFFI